MGTTLEGKPDPARLSHSRNPSESSTSSSSKGRNSLPRMYVYEDYQDLRFGKSRPVLNYLSRGGLTLNDGHTGNIHAPKCALYKGAHH